MEITNEEFLDKILHESYKPHVPKELAINLVSRIYGLEVTEISNMGSFHDQNYRIKVSKNHQNSNIEQVSEDGYTLKIMNTLKTNFNGHLESFHKVLEHLRKKGLRVPHPIKNLDGKTWHFETLPILTKEGDASDKIPPKCGVHLLTYVPGVTVSSIKTTADHFFEWGSMLATFHTSLEDLDCPGLKCQPTFIDVKYFSFIRMSLESAMEGDLYDEETKSIIRNVLERVPSEIVEHMPKLPQGFLHGDFNDGNILVQCKDSNSENPTYTVDGILDFDEMHFGAYVWDLGMMLGHVLVMKKTIDPLEAAGIVIAGYRSRRHMSELELSLLKTCIEKRLITMLLVPIAAKKNPTDTYIAERASLKSKIEMLKLLAAIDKEDLQGIWLAQLEKYT